MKRGFPKNKHKLHSAVEPKPIGERIKNTATGRNRMFKNNLAKRRARKGYK